MQLLSERQDVRLDLLGRAARLGRRPPACRRHIESDSSTLQSPEQPSGCWSTGLDGAHIHSVK